MEFSGTDASAVINSAISALGSRGKIFIKAGTYIISSSISINSGDSDYITLEGEGRSTVLEKGGNCDVLSIIGAGLVGVQIRNLMIDGKRDNHTGGGIYINTPYAGAERDPHHVIASVRVTNTDGDCLQIEGDTREVILNQVTADHTNGNAFNLGGSDHKINGGTAYESKKHGFRIKSYNNQFVNCRAIACGSDLSGNYYGVWMDWVRFNHLAGFQLRNNYRHGLVIEHGCLYNTVVGCVFDSNGRGTGAVGNGLVIRNSITRFNTVAGATFSDGEDPHVQDYGLELSGGAADNVIIGCTFNENQHGPFTGTIGTNIVEHNAGLATE